MRIRTVLLLLPLAVASLPAAAEAQIDLYYSRAAWEAATGQILGSDDFSTFGSDIFFRPEGVTVSTGVGRIGEVGQNLDFRNFVDVAPLVFSDNNGTSHASCAVNHPEPPDAPQPASPGGLPEDTAPARAGEGGEDGTDIILAFSQATRAFGADFFGCGTGEVLEIDLLDAGGQAMATLDCTGNQPFMGFVSRGPYVSSLRFRSKNYDPGCGCEGFGMDNLIAREPLVLTIPTLSTVGFALLALLLAGAGLLLARRRRVA